MKKACAVFGLLLASVLSAHDLFLKAHPFVLERPGKLQLAMNLAASFPGKEERWREDKTVRAWIIGPGSSREFSTEQAKNPVMELPQEGTYVLAWNATPSYIEVDAKGFNEYIEADGYQNVVQMRKESGKQNEKGREKYTRFLKCIVQVGSKLTDEYEKPLGQKIEIIPLEHPYSVKPGSKLRVKVLFDEAPLAGVRVMATFDTYSKEHDVYAHTLETSDDGIAAILIDKPGLWMIRANRMLPLEGDPKADWQSFWTNLTFEVR